MIQNYVITEKFGIIIIIIIIILSRIILIQRKEILIS